MNDPLAHVQPGDDASVLFSARRHNAYADAANYVLGQNRSIGRPMHMHQAASAPVVVMVRNGTGVDLEQFEAIGLSSWLFQPTENLREFASMSLVASSMAYGRWGILQAPIKSGEIGPCCIWGPTIAKITDRDVGPPYSTGSLYCDIHPSPAGGTREAYRVATRLHGLARVLYMPDSGSGLGYARIHIGDSRFQVPVVLKNNQYLKFGPTTEYQCYPVAYGNAVWGPDTDDSLACVRNDSTAYFGRLDLTCPLPFGPGHDDVSSGVYPLVGLVDTIGYYGKPVIIDWPTFGWVQTIGVVDESLITGRLSGLVAWYGDSASNAFDVYANAVGDYRTVLIPEGTYLRVFPGRSPHGVFGGGASYIGLVADVAGFVDETYGAIRILGGSGYIPYGWKLCDGENGTPDLRYRFLMGADSIGGHGGYRYHGDASEPVGYPNEGEENNHLDHTFTTHRFEQNLQIADVVTAINPKHYGNDGPLYVGDRSATDNRPPFYTVKYIMRVRET